MSDSIMDSESASLTAKQRRAIYGLIIFITLGIVASRIATITRDGATPMLSANDRSRWCTIRALVDYGTFAVDDVIYDEKGKRVREWQTIDLVQHRDRNGEARYYSSKPPLFPTMVAGPYYVVKKLTNTTMGERPLFVIRILLALINIPCLALTLYWLSCLVERYGKTDWGRIFVMGTAALGTFATSFAVTLNNHLIAIWAVSGCLLCILRIGREKNAPHWIYFAAGLSAGFAAANELPALSLLCIVVAAALLRNPVRATGTVLGALIVVVAFFVVNYIAHESLRPPYAHRGLGPQIAELEDKQFGDAEAPSITELKKLVPDVEWGLLTPRIETSEEGRLAIWNKWGPYLALQQIEGGWTVHEWDDWYDYPIDRTGTKRRSYWKGEKQGVDRGEPSREVYAFHTLIGHHGIFSLSPLWILAVVGLLTQTTKSDERRWFALAVLLMMVVCLAFYFMRPELDRNYGGVSSGFRWMFWFIPFWLLGLLPVADLSSRHLAARILCCILLAIGVFSVHYGINNPWTQPWIFDYWTWLQWIDYS
jgi:hypothetical protein